MFNTKEVMEEFEESTRPLGCHTHSKRRPPMDSNPLTWDEPLASDSKVDVVGFIEKNKKGWGGWNHENE